MQGCYPTICINPTGDRLGLTADISRLLSGVNRGISSSATDLHDALHSIITGVSLRPAPLPPGGSRLTISGTRPASRHGAGYVRVPVGGRVTEHRVTQQAQHHHSDTHGASGEFLTQGRNSNHTGIDNQPVDIGEGVPWLNRNIPESIIGAHDE